MSWQTPIGSQESSSYFIQKTKELKLKKKIKYAEISSNMLFWDVRTESSLF